MKNSSSPLKTKISAYLVFFLSITLGLFMTSQPQSQTMAAEVPMYSKFCSLCVLNDNQYCNKKCYTKGDSCNQTNGAYITIDYCKDNIPSKIPFCNKNHIITSNDIKKMTKLEGNLTDG